MEEVFEFCVLFVLFCLWPSKILISTCEERCDALYGPARSCRIRGSGCGQSGHCSGGFERQNCVWNLVSFFLEKIWSQANSCLSSRRRARRRPPGPKLRRWPPPRLRWTPRPWRSRRNPRRLKRRRKRKPLQSSTQKRHVRPSVDPRHAMRSSTPPLSPTAFFKVKNDPTGAAELVQPCSCMDIQKNVLETWHPAPCFSRRI